MLYVCVCTHTYIYIHIYIYTSMHRKIHRFWFDSGPRPNWIAGDVCFSRCSGAGVQVLERSTFPTSCVWQRLDIDADWFMQHHLTWWLYDRMIGFDLCSLILACSKQALIGPGAKSSKVSWNLFSDVPFQTIFSPDRWPSQVWKWFPFQTRCPYRRGKCAGTMGHPWRMCHRATTGGVPHQLPAEQPRGGWAGGSSGSNGRWCLAGCCWNLWWLNDSMNLDCLDCLDWCCEVTRST